MLISGRYIRSGALAVAALGLLALTGCGDNSDGAVPLMTEPEDVAGSYTVELTNGDNGCELNPDNWEEGAERSGVGLELTQDDRELTGEVTDPLIAASLTLVLGSAEFEGTVAGSHFTLTNHGTRSDADGECAFTLTATIRGQLEGDAIEGTVTYTYDTNSDPSCGERETCTSVQQFEGPRQPAN